MPQMYGNATKESSIHKKIEFLVAKELATL
jgi:hypothetical protein